MKPRLAATVLLAGAIALTACSRPADTHQGAPASPTGLEISDARLLLPPVKGNPAAIYFDVRNGGSRNVSIRSVSVKDAQSALLHDMEGQGSGRTMGEMAPLVVTPGSSVAFKPGGKHVMVYGLSPDLKPGDTTAMKLTIAGGESITAKVPVQAAGAAR